MEAWPKTIIVPKAPEVLKGRLWNNKTGARRKCCAIGWVNLSFFGGPQVRFHESTPARVRARSKFMDELRRRMREAAGTPHCNDIPLLNDRFLTPGQVARCIDDTAAHFGYTEVA